MKKVFGIQAEFNITCDEDITKGIGKGISRGTITLDEIIKDVKPEIVAGIKKAFLDDKKTENNQSSKKEE